MKIFLRLAAVLTIWLVASVLVGCDLGSRLQPTATPNPTPTPIDLQSLLRRSGEATGGLHTFHFKLEHNPGGSTPLAESLVITEAEGRVVSPDRISVDFAGTLGTFAVRSSLITLADKSYMTNPLTGAWEKVARDVSPVGFFDPRQGIGAMMSGLQSPVLVSRSDNAFRIDGILDVDALRPLLGAAVHGTTVRVKLTIDADTLFLERAVIEGRVTEIEPDGVVRTISLSRFNQPVSIDPPG